MITLAEVVRALAGTLRLARFDPRGIDAFENTLEGFWRSFYAAGLVAVPYVLLLAIETERSVFEASPFRFVTVKAAAYVAVWVAYPLVMVYLTRAMNCAAGYFRFIAAYNWANVPVVLLMLLSAVLLDYLVGPEEAASNPPAGLVVVATTVGSGVFVALFAYNWFIAKTALAVGAGSAAGVVILRMVIASVISAVATTLIEAG